ncbi:Bardet-Biedl syndrome 5 protein [Chytriomyces sp. MP71]|nr:Bardet-Biedl syndrome 5 protein [Chytriomyces sp. MP71]
MFSSLFGAANKDIHPHWQHQEIRIDSSESALRLVPGETLVRTFPNVQDKKGSNGEDGSLTVTTLRLIWRSKRNRRGNLSIGHDCIYLLSSTPEHSVVHGRNELLHVEAKFAGTRFEFVFRAPTQHTQEGGCGGDAAGSLAAVAGRLHTSFVETRIYRDLRVKSAIVTDGELDLLEFETVHAQIQGVVNVSSDKGVLGRIVFTNIRTVWFSTLTGSSNISLPYLQIASVKVTQSKYGPAIAIETYGTRVTGSYRLGFQIPGEGVGKLKEVASFVQAARKNYMECPVFGVQFEDSVVEKGKLDGRGSQATLTEDESLFVDGEEAGMVQESDECHRDLFETYAQDGSGEVEFVYDENLGLAVARPKGSHLTSLDVWP